VIVNLYFASFSIRKPDQAVVQAAPESPKNFAVPSYEGPHPALMTRPQDPFQYPIKVGQIGPVAPLFSGPLQYPFLCGNSRHGQPLVDNQEGIGVPVYQVDPVTNQRTHVVVGYSKDCQIPTRIEYYYNREGTDQFYPLSDAQGDIAKTEVNGQQVPFIVRVEVGTINRFFYLLAALKGPDEIPEHERYLNRPDTAYWNQRLIYQFRGGVGIGKRQGNLNPGAVIARRKELLGAGFGIAYSTGNQTSNHYNLWLAEETAIRVKSQFVARYGEPLRTLGIGGSGGAIQQLILAQNHPGILDGALALYSYSDMITQTIYAFDCELLEYYFDVTAKDMPLWQQWENRTLIQGLNARADFSNKFTPYYNLARFVWGVWPPIAQGMSECVNGWRGLTQLTNNPHFTHLSKYYDQKVLQDTHWTHWDDLRYFYGVRESGFAKQTWDNVGVQYGLNALKSGQLSPEVFLHINRHVGGWKPPEAFQQERYWKIVPEASLWEFSPWSHHNMWLTDSDLPAPRTRADRDAVRAAFLSGHVFVGKVDIPVLDMRHYLEDQLDMHHLSASFAMRKRIEDYYGGRADQHVIWVMPKPYQPVREAIEALDQWVEAKSVGSDIAGAKITKVKPVDSCFDEAGKVIASGQGVWDGEWNGASPGECSLQFPAYRTSRIVAGSRWQGDVFYCQRQSAKTAVESGLYEPIDMTPHLEELTRTFPDGVCDYSEPFNDKVLTIQALKSEQPSL